MIETMPVGRQQQIVARMAQTRWLGTVRPACAGWGVCCGDGGGLVGAALYAGAGAGDVRMAAIRTFHGFRRGLRWLPRRARRTAASLRCGRGSVNGAGGAVRLRAGCRAARAPAVPAWRRW